MNTSRTRIAVIGGGLAAHTAAQTLAKGSADVVMIHPKSPGATALWSGLGQAFGPASEFLPYSTGLVGAQERPQRSMALRRVQRFELLENRRAYHPYTRLGLSSSDVRSALAEAVSDLGYPGLQLIGPELVLPSPSAAPYPADLAASSVSLSAIVAGDRVGIVCCASLADWHPHRLLDALRELDSVDACALDVAPFDGFTGNSEHSVKVANRLANALAEQPDLLLDALQAQVDEHEIDLLLLPPCIGRTFAEHDEIFERLTDALSCRVAEAAAAKNSIHGWRLDRFLRARQNVEVVSSRVRRANIAQGRVRSVTTDNGDIEADAYVLATGRWIGGGLPTSTPLREPILGVDLWLDGAPLPNAELAWPPNLLDRHVWDDHPLFRTGLGTDRLLRPLDREGAPVADNIFAAGRMLAGFHPFLDGTTEGVDLITGHFAAQYALAHTTRHPAPPPSKSPASPPSKRQETP